MNILLGREKLGYSAGEYKMNATAGEALESVAVAIMIASQTAKLRML